VGRGIREVLLTLAALGGVACIVLVIMAFAGGYSLIMFKTGSMSPTIPAGSVALVQKIPAEQIAVGDVVTVDREGKLPITHRVTGVEPGDVSSERIITMRGDANESDDIAPYVVSEVRIVRGSLPHLAYVIVWLGNPWTLGAITLGASLLVGWAFWPRSEKREQERAPDAAAVPISEEEEPVLAGVGLRRDRRT